MYSRLLPVIAFTSQIAADEEINRRTYGLAVAQVFCEFRSDSVCLGRKIIYAFRVTNPYLFPPYARYCRVCVFSDWLRQRELISPRFSSRGLSTDFHSDRVSAKSISVSHFNFSSRRPRHTTLKFLSRKRDYAIRTFCHANRYFANSRSLVISNHVARSRSNFRCCVNFKLRDLR